MRPATCDRPFVSDSDAAVRRQTQTDNDASGNPQRVAGRQPPLSVLAATLHFPLVSAWWAKKAFRTSPTDAAERQQTQTDNIASSNSQLVKNAPTGACK